MSLEQMKKEELVKLARELQQEVKLLKVEQKSKEEVENTSEEVKEISLPYKAAASIKVSTNKSRMFVIDFNLENQCSIRESSFGAIEHYKIQQKVDQFNADVVFRKNVMVKKSEGEDNGN